MNSFRFFVPSSHFPSRWEAQGFWVSSRGLASLKPSRRHAVFWIEFLLLSFFMFGMAGARGTCWNFTYTSERSRGYHTKVRFEIIWFLYSICVSLWSRLVARNKNLCVSKSTFFFVIWHQYARVLQLQAATLLTLVIQKEHIHVLITYSACSQEGCNENCRSLVESWCDSQCRVQDVTLQTARHNKVKLINYIVLW